MSQRNPNNERYQQEKRTGTTRKSASSAKPKTKAANSVVMGSNTKSKAQKEKESKDARKQARREQRELERKYYTPPTEKFKKLKRLWWVCLGAAVACTLISWFGRSVLPSQVCFVVLLMAYAFIIGALYLDLGVMRKERRKYAAEKEAAKTKEGRAAAREEKRRAREAELKAAREAAANGETAKAEPEPVAEKKSRFGFLNKGSDKSDKSDKSEGASSENSEKKE